MRKQHKPASAEWGATLAAHTSFVRQCANKLTGDYEKAKDLAQDVLIQALERQEMFREQDNLRGWLRTITRNLFINKYRQTREFQFVGEPTDSMCYELSNYPATARNDGQYTYDLELIDAMIVKHVRHPSKHHTEQVLRLRMDGYAYEDIASELDMPVGSVRSALFRARNVMADAIGVGRV